MRSDDLYSRPSVVSTYAAAQDLQPPESTILSELKSWLKDKTVLDIGVGGGRTTVHLADTVHAYYGVDASQEMIAACRKRFQLVNGNRGPNNFNFQVADVRSMALFADDSFDFVLFSFNGIDELPAAGRVAALEEIYRVLRWPGYFCFSSHNLQCVDLSMLSLRRHLAKNPKRLLRKLTLWPRARFHNRHLFRTDLAKEPWTIVYDYDHGEFIKTFYIRPEEQKMHLQQLFADVRVFSLRSGRELDDPELDSVTDRWLYYLCTATLASNESGIPL